MKHRPTWLVSAVFAVLTAFGAHLSAAEKIAVRVDFTRPIGELKALHGINKRPLAARSMIDGPDELVQPSPPLEVPRSHSRPQSWKRVSARGTRPCPRPEFSSLNSKQSIDEPACSKTNHGPLTLHAKTGWGEGTPILDGESRRHPKNKVERS